MRNSVGAWLAAWDAAGGEGVSLHDRSAELRNAEGNRTLKGGAFAHGGIECLALGVIQGCTEAVGHTLKE